MATPELEDPPLSVVAAAQGGIVTTQQLLRKLGDRATVRRAVRAGHWLPQGRGAYADGALLARAADDPRLRHQLHCAARVLLSDRDVVVSHRSAAVLQDLRLLDPYTGPPELTLARPPGTLPAHVRGVHAAGLPRRHRTGLDGLSITTRARTVADLARTLPRPDAVVLADAALRAGLDRQAVLDVLAACRRWPGRAGALEVVRFADRRAESALESLARVWLVAAGLPAPDLQSLLCRDDDGQFLGRVDFFWPQHRTVCEVDGRVKYSDAGPPGGALWQEKLREDALRDAGLEVVRGYWSDGRDGGASLVVRVQRAFARAALRNDAPTYGVRRMP